MGSLDAPEDRRKGAPRQLAVGTAPRHLLRRGVRAELGYGGQRRVTCDECLLSWPRSCVSCWSPRSPPGPRRPRASRDRKSTRLNSSHSQISYAVFCLNIITNLMGVLRQVAEFIAVVLVLVD